MPRPPIRLERHPLSGHSHRVELMQGAHKRPEFLARIPFGQVPVIDDDDFVLADSNAILVYLGRRYGAEHWLPNDPEAAIAHVPEGNVSLAAYPRIRAWLERIEKRPGFVPMQRTAVGLQSVA